MNIGEMGKGPVVAIIVALVVAVVAFALLPSIFSEWNVVLLFSRDTARNPIFSGGIGGLVPLILGFFPIIIILGMIGFAFLKSRSGSM